MDVGEPNNTIFIKNLNEKYSKARMLDELKTILRKKFSTYGEVVDIVALSNFYSKGQAFVVFKELEAAKKAIAAEQGQILSLPSIGGGKDMVIAFARAKSDALAKADGTFEPRPKRVRPTPPTGVKPKSDKMEEDGGRANGLPPPAAPADAGGYPPPQPQQQPQQPQQFQPPPQQQQWGAPPPASSAQAPGYPGGPPPPGMQMGGPPPPVWGGASGPPPPMGGPPGYGGPPARPPAPQVPGVIPPHPILFLENLPEDATTESISAVFSQCAGFKEVRLVPSRPGLGFAEFENEMQSGMAMSRLQGHTIGEKAMKITFSKS